jgi:hypothetical protein
VERFCEIEGYRGMKRKFEVGDRVVSTDGFNLLPSGSRGIVELLYESREEYVRVRWTQASRKPSFFVGTMSDMDVKDLDLDETYNRYKNLEKLYGGKE